MTLILGTTKAVTYDLPFFTLPGAGPQYDPRIALLFLWTNN